MALESGTYVSDLVPTNPSGAADPKSQGDDHLRLIKSVLKNTFPDASRAFYFGSVVTKTADYTVTAADDRSLILADASSAALTITLPLGSSVPNGFSVFVKKIDNTANAVTVAASGGDQINGAASRKVDRQHDVERYMWGGSAWHVVGQIPGRDNVRIKAVDTGGSADSYTLTSGLSLTSYQDGLALIVVINATNTGPATLNVDGLGAKALKKEAGTDLVAGDLVAGYHYLITYDLSIDAFIVHNPSTISVGTNEIVDNAVTLAKMADITAPAILGRNTSGMGDPEVLSPDTVTDMLRVVSSTAQGVAPSGGSAGTYLEGTGSWSSVKGTWKIHGTSAASGSYVDFTNLPANIQSLKITFYRVQPNANVNILLQLGTASSIVTSGYYSTMMTNGGNISVTDGFLVCKGLTGSRWFSGRYEINRVTGNAWAGSGSGSVEAAGESNAGGGNVDTGAELTRVRVTLSGAGNFTSGTIRLLYLVA